MSNAAVLQTDGKHSHTLMVLLLLFAGTGCSALIYENVWYQTLELAIGSSAVSLGVLLATFMGGLCLGSLLLPKILPLLPRHWQHPLRTYAAIEILIGILGIIELAAIPLIGGAYVAGAQSGLPSVLLRSLVTIVTLLPPTMLMGASLPAIVRLFDADKNGAARWGLFYGGNTAGAVFGCLFAAFVLLRNFDVTTATFVAASINFAAAIIALTLAPRVLFTTVMNARADALTHEGTGPAWTVYLVIGISGACALGAEVVWTRLMGLMLGGTVYAFAIILAAFLVGLVIGTAAATQLVGRVNARVALGICQFLAAFAIAWSAYMIAEALPYWPINPTLSRSAGVTFQLDFVRTFIAIFRRLCFGARVFLLPSLRLLLRISIPAALSGVSMPAIHLAPSRARSAHR